MDYLVNETFYSLKGEGMYTGFPMFFIRLSGCNLKCHFCDTLHQTGEFRSIESLVEEAKGSGAERVVITGGEPLIHNIWPLCSRLEQEDFTLHLETNGTIVPPAVFKQHWIACSPKSDIETLQREAVTNANELKFLVGEPGWEEYIDKVVERFNPIGTLYVMPVSVGGHPGIRGPEDLIEDNVELAIQYCLDHPRFALCLQAHKLLSIR